MAKESKKKKDEKNERKKRSAPIFTIGEKQVPSHVTAVSGFALSGAARHQLSSHSELLGKLCRLQVSADQKGDPGGAHSFALTLLSWICRRCWRSYPGKS